MSQKFEINLEDVVTGKQLLKFYNEFMEGVKRQKEKIGGEKLLSPKGQQELFLWAQAYLQQGAKNSHVQGDIRANQLHYRANLHIMQGLDNKNIQKHLNKRNDYDGNHLRLVKLRYTDQERNDYEAQLEVENYVEDANLDEIIEKHQKDLNLQIDPVIREASNLTLIQNINRYFSMDGLLLVQEASRNKDYSVRKAYKDIAFLCGARPEPANDTSGNQIVSSDPELLYTLLNDKRKRIGNKNLELDKKGMLLVPKKMEHGKIVYKKKPILLQYNQREFEQFKTQAEDLNADYIRDPRPVDPDDKDLMHYQINMDHMFNGLGVETQFIPLFAYKILTSGALAHTERYEKARRSEDMRKFREAGINFIVEDLVYELFNLYSPHKKAA